MAIKRRLTGYSGMRLDWPHIRSIESAVSNDFDSLLRGLVTGISTPYIIRGFRVKIPTASINASSLQIEVADSVVLHSTATESGTILVVPPGTPDEVLESTNPRVIGSFQSGIPNYVALDYRRITDTTTIDQTAGWSASQQIEYQRTSPISRILDYRFVITTNGFGTNLPLFIVGVSNSGTVDYITNAKQSLFRLGSGGANPNPQFSYNFGNLVNSQPGAHPRREWLNTNPSLPNQLSVAPGAPAEAFDYGDFSIKNLKEWMDAVMTRIKEITGSPYWYFSGGLNNPSPNIMDVWWDSIGSVMTGNGTITYNMVLEATPAISGLFQSSFEDPTILDGDSYVQGFTSGTKAIVSAVTGSQLLIHSLNNSSFIFDEILLNRRLFRPDLSKFILSSYSESPNRLAQLKRANVSTGSFIDISSWSYNNINGTDLNYSLVDITTATPHGFQVGDFVHIKGLTLSTSTVPPNGVVYVKEILSPTQFRFAHAFVLSGTTGILSSPLNGVRIDSSDRIPYMPRFKVTSWSYSGTSCTLVVPDNNFAPPIFVTGNISSGSNIITGISSTAGMKLNQSVSGTGIPSGTVITKIISGTSIEISQNATSTLTGNPLTIKDIVNINGLVAATNAPNGRYTVDNLGLNPGEIVITASAAPTGTPTVSNAYVRPDVHIFTLSIKGANVSEYNLQNVNATIVSDAHLKYNIGPDTLPPINTASGLIELDGVIAVSTVMNPVRVSSITNDGTGNLTITTTTPHGLNTVSSITFTIFGNPANSIYIRTYQNVSIQYVSPTQFILQGTNILGLTSYTNPSNSHDTFIKFSNNPYAGPIQWSSDIYIKGIIGDKFYRIPQSAICETVANDSSVSPLANQFNINGKTGTAYLQDGEVAFIKLERNKIVSNGAIYSTAGGAIVTGSTPPLDINGNNLVAGDFVKWEDEDESKWLRIAGTFGTPILTNSFTLIDDQNQTPSTAHRPPKSGKLVYCKGSYNKIFVKKHWQVDSSADIYWIAVRRDNGSTKSRMYLRDLELEAGERREINDNEPTNLLAYTGAASEAEINPNYSIKATGAYSFSQILEVEDVDNFTRMVTFTTSPDLNFAKGDKVIKIVGTNQHVFTVKHTLSSRTVVFEEDTSILAATDIVTYNRVNYNIEDSDNLTVGLRKEDRELAKINTALNRPIYDESVFVQKITLSGTGTIRSGSYIYTGSQTNPTALAWVLHGNAPVTETIESATIQMPGGHSSVGSNAILVHIISGTFNHGDGLYQNGVLTGRTVNNPGNPPFPAPQIEGGGVSGVELVLPPNRRTQVKGTSYVVFPTHSQYKASLDPDLTGEELIVIANDSIRQAGLDYLETFGGPKAKIKLVRTLPENTRIRFRVLPAYGSSLAAKAGDVTLQSAYNGGRFINEYTGGPIDITSGNPLIGETAMILRGSLEIDGGTNSEGGIFGVIDQAFVIGKESNKPKESWTAFQAIKTHLSHPLSANFTKTTAQTVTGDIGTIISGSEVTLPDMHAVRIRVKAVARRSDGPLGNASFTMEGTFYRNGAGATASGSPMTRVNGADGDGTDYAIAFGLVGNDVVSVVYGTSGATVQWALTIEYQMVGLAS